MICPWIMPTDWRWNAVHSASAPTTRKKGWELFWRKENRRSRVVKSRILSFVNIPSRVGEGIEILYDAARYFDV
jgi:hypothetical protein